MNTALAEKAIERQCGNSSGGTPSVLVLDGDMPAALAAVRSLGRRGLQVEVGYSGPRPLSVLSRYCTSEFQYPDPMSDLHRFRDALLAHIRRRAHGLIVPVTDRTICPLMSIRPFVEEHVPVAMASNDALAVALSKSQTNQLAQRMGVPIPRTWVVRAEDDIRPVESNWTFPAVVKPDQSKVWSQDGEGKHQLVRYAKDPAECKEFIYEYLPSGPVVVQEFVPGCMALVCLLSQRGEVILATTHRTLHNVPLTGGQGSYRIMEKPHPQALAQAAILIKELAWTGVAMVEFRECESSGELLLGEINGRFWFSLPIHVAAGADYPAYLYDIHARGVSPRIGSFRVGYRSRDLKNEVKWLKSVLRRDPTLRHLVLYPKPSQIFGDCLRLLNPSEWWDSFELTDPRPGLTELAQVLRAELLALSRASAQFLHAPKLSV